MCSLGIPATSLPVAPGLWQVTSNMTTLPAYIQWASVSRAFMTHFRRIRVPLDRLKKKLSADAYPVRFSV